MCRNGVGIRSKLECSILLVLYHYQQQLFRPSVCIEQSRWLLAVRGRIEGVVHVDGGDDVPGAPRSPGEDDEVPGADLGGGALRRAFHGGARLASHDVARLPRSVAQRVPPRRTAPPATNVFQRLRVTRRENA